MVRVAVVGAGPAGFYAARALLKRGVDVDILERLPVPFGLVRYGVAPDHPETKNATRGFADIVHRSGGRVRFRGNVNIAYGPSSGEMQFEQAALRLEDLKEMYPLVISATGAANPRSLPADVYPGQGQACERVHLAHHFVAWLNGHPYYANRGPVFPSKGGSVAVVGAGNVALDCARMLLRPPSSLAATDISPRALSALEDARVANVGIFARRRPRDAAWSTAALRELVTKIDGIRCSVEDPQLVADDLDGDGTTRALRRRLELLSKLDSKSSGRPDGSTSLRFHFCMTPTYFFEDRGQVEIGFNLSNRGPGPWTPESVCHSDVVGFSRKQANLVLLSLGYIGGNPYDAGSPAVGWANGHGSGIIGDNMVDAETVIAGLSDKQLGLSSSGRKCYASTSAVDNWAKGAGVQLVDWNGWDKINEEEMRRGEEYHPQRERLKIETISEMLDVAGEAQIAV